MPLRKTFCYGSVCGPCHTAEARSRAPAKDFDLCWKRVEERALSLRKKRHRRLHAMQRLQQSSPGIPSSITARPRFHKGRPEDFRRRKLNQGQDTRKPVLRARPAGAVINGFEDVSSMTPVPRAIVALHNCAGVVHPPLFLGFPLPLEAREHCRLRCGHLHIHKPPHDVLFDGDYPARIKQLGRSTHFVGGEMEVVTARSETTLRWCAHRYHESKMRDFLTYIFVTSLGECRPGAVPPCPHGGGGWHRRSNASRRRQT
jgi:hypothetical protein